ncbi:MAG TPA: hypothetical protein VG106_11205, partial [Vicinamibacterales bacterium]|nr:hypothetical protein [Vicinamibacterales bacterium]
MKRVASLLCAIVIAFVACGGRQDIFRTQPSPDSGGFEIPDPVPAAPAYVARLPKPLGNNKVKKVSRIEGIAVLAPVSLGRVPVSAPVGVRRITVAAVDPLPFRSVAPPSTRDADFVWTALFSDHAVMTFEAAQRLKVDATDELVIAGVPLRVGAFADNGMPNIADIVVSTRVARAMKIGSPNVLVVGAKTGTTIETLGKDLRKQLPKARLQRIRAVTTSSSAAPQQVGQASGATIGTMTFRILSNGFIDPDDAWVAANIAYGSVPILGSVRCHRITIPQLAERSGEL